jgi:putative ABC transport system permease protein
MTGKRRTLILAELRESLSMALGALTAHKLRSSLTLVGVLIGVFSIIVVMTAMRVLERSIESNLSELGSHTFAIQKWPKAQFGNRADWEKYRRRKNVSIAQARQVEERATLASCVGIEEDYWSGEVETEFKRTPPSVQLYGETPGSFPAHNWVAAEGRVLTEPDVENARDVCVLGSALAKSVFPYGAAVGNRLKIAGINYTVIGVLAPKGGTLGGDQDNFVLIPITTGYNRFGGWWTTVTILVQAPDAASYEDTKEQVRGILRVLRKTPPGADDDFELFSNESLIAQFNSFSLAARIGVAVVSSIALLAAGVGIMNIMLVSVTERTREIGIRRAVGAKRRNVMIQFILEAIVLCEVGGILGVALGVLGGNSVAWLLKVPPVLPVDWTVLGLVICSIVGILFGTYPAWKAANLDPIESLRYE